MKRLFIAVPVCTQTRNEIVKRIFTDVRVKTMPVRWTSYENLHLTVQFLGDVEEKRIPQLKKIMDSVLLPAGPDILRFTAVGAFPNPAAARIIWLGMEKNDYLLKMQKDLSSALISASFPADRKSFKPHLTIGRVRDNARLTPDALPYLSGLAGQASFTDSPLDRITLYESVLRPGGPIYTAVYHKTF